MASKKDSKGDLIGKARSSALYAAADLQTRITGNAPSPHEDSVNDRALLANLVWLLNQEGGWLRAIPSNDEGVIYFKWKFNKSPWTNHYVMSRVQYWQVSYGIALLRDKVQAVYDGEKPVPDRPFE